MSTLGDVKGKGVILRVDINSPIKNGKVLDNARIREHARTIKELAERGAKLVVLAHQGRPGREDFLPLEQHAMLLSKHVGKEVKYVDGVIGKKVVEKIKSLCEGEILLLANVRSLEEEMIEKSPEEHAQGELVQTLAPLADLYINDAFSVSHRSHASMVGFTAILPSLAGPVLEREVRALERSLRNITRPFVLMLSGAKPDDVIDVLFSLAPKADKIMLAGVIGDLFLLANGQKLGGTEIFLRKRGWTRRMGDVKELAQKYARKIKIPVDLAFEVNGKRKEFSIGESMPKGREMDIGHTTAKCYANAIMRAGTVLMKGTPGVFERKEFAFGTKEILRAAASSKAFSLVGGGHISTALEQLGFKRSDFSHVSLAGGAFIKYLTGKTMPALQALKIY